MTKVKCLFYTQCVCEFGYRRIIVEQTYRVGLRFISAVVLSSQKDLCTSIDSVILILAYQSRRSISLCAS